MNVDGYDYRLRKSISMTGRQARQMVRNMMAAGCRRRVEAGETFIHVERCAADPGGAAIAIEFYARLP